MRYDTVHALNTCHDTRHGSRDTLEKITTPSPIDFLRPPPLVPSHTVTGAPQITIHHHSPSTPITKTLIHLPFPVYSCKEVKLWQGAPLPQQCNADLADFIAACTLPCPSTTTTTTTSTTTPQLARTFV
ncbi:hypothetical protein E2C01_046418 [Portunus trituberculatus]|uniref:Uncharacterized protein n=1 Tax=Portunus trituberculatus TaxID=210409 RepID=A0A5B7G4U6_PORTR|nr:hypothetical protein [Portunus trituberculatus]